VKVHGVKHRKHRGATEGAVRLTHAMKDAATTPNIVQQVARCLHRPVAV
jgi:hypothetical protein